MGRRRARNPVATALTAAAVVAASLAGVGGGHPPVPASAATNEGDVSLVANFGGYGHGFPGSLQFRRPWGIAAGPDGDYYVTELGFDRLRHVSTDGDDLGTWGGPGAAEGQFEDPLGVAVGPDGSVYVADTGNDRVQRFDGAGAFLTSWGGTGSATDQFDEPSGIAVAGDGTVYVADTGNDRIQAFDATGTFLTSWGPGANPVRAPVDVAVAPDDTVLVANQSGTNRVQRYTNAGAFLAQWTSNSVSPVAVDTGPDGRVYVTQSTTGVPAHHRSWVLDAALSTAVAFGETLEDPPSASELEPGLLFGPKGLAVAADGVVTVVDSYGTNPTFFSNRTDWLSSFDADGAPLSRLGSADNPASPQLLRPADLALAPSGDQYVVEVGNNRVQRLTDSGAYVSHWGGPLAGSGPGQFDAPESVAVDASGDVLVADTGNDRVQRFSADGTFEAQWGSTGTANGQFQGPSGIAVDPESGDVFVADSGNDRVQRFSAAGAFEAAWHGALDDPGDLAVGRGPSIYVLDNGHHRVRRFTRSGGEQVLFEEVSAVAPEVTPIVSPLRYQGAITVDATGNLFVSREEGVAEYSPSGAFVREWDLGVRWRSGVAVDGAHRLVTLLDLPTDTKGSIHQLTTGSLVTVRAGFDRSSGAVGVPLHARLIVANTGTATLTGVSVSDPNAPGCGGPVPDLAPGDEHLSECVLVPSSVGVLSHVATVSTDQIADVTSESASADIAVAQGPVLQDEWGTAGEGTGQLDTPAALAVDPSGDVLIANTGNDVVSRFDAAGHFESGFTSPDPLDVDTDAAGNVFTTRIAGQAGNGELRRSDPVGVEQWTAPVGYATRVGVSQDGRAWFASPRITVCSDTCTVISEAKVSHVNASGGADGQFPIDVSTASEVAVHDATDQVYVPQGQNIFRYTRGGQPLGSFSVGTADEPNVRDLDVDAAGNLYVALLRLQAPDLVKVFDPAGTLLARWETPSADAVSVAPDGTVFVLDAAGTRVRHYGIALAGRVTASGGAPIPGAWALALDLATGRVVGTTTDEDGRYGLATGLGERVVGFIDPSGGHDGEWFDDHPLDHLDDADPVAVSGGEPAVADAELGPAGRTASVAGTVTEDGTGIPLEGVWVAALDLGDDATARAVQTDGDGHYSIDGLAGRAHLLVAFDPTGRHRIEYFDGHGTAASADQIDLVAGEATTADVGLRLRPPRAGGARIGGLIRVGGQPRRGVLVLAFDATRGSFVRAALTGGAGRYRLDVPPGAYHLAYLDPSGTSAPEWHRDRPFLASDGRRVVVATAGAPATVNATLAASGPSGSIVGTVTGPDSEAVSGAWVAAADIATGSIVRGTVADLDGAYEIDGLQAGSYALLVLDPSGAYAVEWYDDAPDLGSATPVVVAAGATTNVDDHLAVAP